jgi:hypothetical protein
VSIMPTIDDARRLAERLASEASLRTGRPWRGFVEEFEHGWAVWTVPPAGERPPIGLGKTVLDKETGGVTHWPSWPTSVLASEYAAAAPKPSAAPQPPGVLPLLIRERWIESPDGRVWRAESWMADAPPSHHPLVAQWLSDQDKLVRGAERHAELLVLSTALHDDHVDTELLKGCSTEGRPCDTCTQAYVHFGLLGEAALDTITPTTGDFSTDMPPFPTGHPFDAARWASFAFDLLAPAITPVEAARGVIERLPAAVSSRRGPGHDVWIRPFKFGVTRALKRHAPALAGFAELLQTALFPVGEEENADGVIVVAGDGRLLVLDQAGAWFLGGTTETAIETLNEGHQPLHERGSTHG